MSEDYTMEELLPIVKDLAELYTSKASTSITYDAARVFMEAIQYVIRCGRMGCDRQQIMIAHRDARTEYAAGIEMVNHLIQEALGEYNQLMVNYEDYGNKNYGSVVRDGIPGFFLYYQPKFKPQDTILTLDYPTLIPLDMREMTGIVAIKQYIHYLFLEQTFLKKFDPWLLREILSHYRQDYVSQYFNLAMIIERNLLAARLSNLPTLGSRTITTDMRLKKKVDTMTVDEMENLFNAIIHQLIRKEFSEKEDLEEYLRADCRNFAVGLKEIEDPKYYVNLF